MIVATTALCCLALSAPQFEEPPIRISVLSLLNPQVVEVSCERSIELEFDTPTFIPEMIHPGEVVQAEIRNDQLVLSLRSQDGREEELPEHSQVRFKGSTLDNPLVIRVISPNKFGRGLVGELLVRNEGGRLQLILTAGLEQVVGEVVAAEMGNATPPHAAAALAVAVRSYILAMKGRNGSESYDILDTTQSLLYRGRDGALGPGSESSLEIGRAAASETRGLTLTNGDKVVPGFFHACCGGFTATPEMIWKGAANSESYKRCRCEFCVESPLRHWINRAPLLEVLGALRIEEMAGSWNFKVACYTDSSYVSSVNVSGINSRHEFSGEDFRLRIGRSLGWNILRSNAYSVTVAGGEVVFEGYGFGHGVGLCQEGAAEAARVGWDWRRILSYYYPRCRIKALEWRRLGKSAVPPG